MALFATLERDSPEADKLVTLAHLASDFQDRFRSDPQKGLNILMIGYLTAAAVGDAVKEEIERGLMNKSILTMSKTLTQMGVPIDKLYLGDLVFSSSKGRKIDLFMEQQGEARHSVPGNPAISGYKIPTINPPKPVRDAELKINSNQELVLEVTARKIESGKRILIPELSFKSSTGISPVAISKGFDAELTVLRPKLESVLKKIGQEGLADKIEFSVQIVGGGKISKEFARQISTEVAASLKVALNINITIPGTKHELPIELSYSYGAAYKDGGVTEKGEGMITVTIFRFKSW
jgi:hypothetical protein